MIMPLKRTILKPGSGSSMESERPLHTGTMCGSVLNISSPNLSHKVIIPNAGTTLSACLQIGLPNVGVTMDMGHALYVGEGTAWAAGLLSQAGKLFLVHVNDNYRNWDWDMIPGSVNTWDLVELMFYLDEIGYNGWMTSDVAPFRLDPVKTCSSTYRSLIWAERVVEKVGRDELRRIVREGDPIDALDALQKLIS
jgi:xylose isomerase